MTHLNYWTLSCTLAALLLPSLRAADDAHTKAATPLHVSHGETVQLSDYLVPGKITVVDFYSKYCPPCMAFAPHMEELHEKRADVAVVEVDINRPGVKGIDWKSPVAREFNLESIPHFTIFGPDGKQLKDGDEAYQQVQEWVGAL